MDKNFFINIWFIYGFNNEKKNTNSQKTLRMIMCVLLIKMKKWWLKNNNVDWEKWTIWCLTKMLSIECALKKTRCEKTLVKLIGNKPFILDFVGLIYVFWPMTVICFVNRREQRFFKFYMLICHVRLQFLPPWMRGCHGYVNDIMSKWNSICLYDFLCINFWMFVFREKTME